MAAALGLGTTGCRVNEDDIHRWESTAHGPDKLKAVLYHDKYENALRVEAALSLVRMKPRAGRRIGINIMVETLAGVAPEARQAIVASLVPALIAELKKPPPVGQAGQPTPPDASYAYKDAAFAMLTHDGTVIIADEGLKTSLKAALVEWAMSDFVHRLENRSQAYGMEQLLRFIGPAAVAGLPKLMTREVTRLDAMAGLVAELGDEKTKAAGSQALVGVAQFILSDEWTKVKKPELQAANAASKLQPTEKQFQAQLSQYQDEELTRLFGSMRKIGQRPVIDFCLDFAAKKDQAEKRRQAALAALEARLDRNNTDDIKRIFAIAASDAPDIVLDQAFKRIGEMPREQVVDKLYDLFKTDKWKVRRAAGATVIKMSTVKHIDEFLAKLPDTSKGYGMPESITYGALLGELKEGKPLDALKKHFSSGSAAARTTALSYWLTYGTKADIPSVQPYEGDSTKVPTCDADSDCKWNCEVAKEGGKEREQKDIKTVGDFVKYCIEPAMAEKQAEAKK
ncbi:Hypothetical protein A7982_09772 [Minicystis rosea]|nr:Hypothetical protein A7982_09772 [Minicystis rosea]